MALQPKHLLFAMKYVELLNETKAAIAAGYSEKTAYSQGSRLLKNVEVRAEIERLMTETAMGKNEVLYRLSQIARADIDDVMTIQGNLPFVDIQRAQELAKTGLIKKIKVGKQGIEFELHDKMRALEMLGKYYALFTDKVQVEDWRSQAIADIKAGKISYEALKEAFDTETAAELYQASGLPIPPSEGAGLIQ